MIKFVTCLAVLLGTVISLSAQYTYTIKADSVKLTNCDSSELIIENHTQNVPGFLFNTGNGRTIFKRGVQKINDSLYLIGADTLKTPSRAWLQGGNSFGTTGILGTLDNNHLDLYTNNARQARLTSTGNLLLGTTTDAGYKLQILGTGGAGGLFFQPNLSRPSDRIAFGGYWNTGDGQDVAISASNNYGATYSPVLSVRDGNIGLGPFAGWGLPGTLRIRPDGTVAVGSQYFFFGNYGGPYNSSALVTYVSNSNEWTTGLGTYPSGQNYYSFGTMLQTPGPGTKRAPLHIGADQLQFMTGTISDAEAGRFTEAGHLLIGSTVDDGTHLLQIRGAMSASSAQLNGSSGGSVLSALRPVDFALMNIASVPDQNTLILGGGNQNNVDIYGHTNFIARFSNSNGGQMGLGTGTPTAQLHTTGTVRLAGLTSDSTKTRIIVSDVNGNLFYRDASTLASLDPIRSSLAVNGTITAQKLILPAHDWPDYVFDIAYHLPSPDSLRNYIKENNHLPDAPSAAEVDRKSIDVGDNQKLLLKKIEELTLYMLKQEERIQNMEQQIQQHNKVIEKLKMNR